MLAARHLHAGFRAEDSHPQRLLRSAVVVREGVRQLAGSVPPRRLRGEPDRAAAPFRAAKLLRRGPEDDLRVAAGGGREARPPDRAGQGTCQAPRGGSRRGGRVSMAKKASSSGTQGLFPAGTEFPPAPPAPPPR